RTVAGAQGRLDLLPAVRPGQDGHSDLDIFMFGVETIGQGLPFFFGDHGQHPRFDRHLLFFGLAFPGSGTGRGRGAAALTARRTAGYGQNQYEHDREDAQFVTVCLHVRFPPFSVDGFASWLSNSRPAGRPVAGWMPDGRVCHGTIADSFPVAKRSASDALSLSKNKANPS